MNEFIEQFLIEARELVEQATADLLALEAQPGDRARLDGAFRAFHTLKGAAGIIDFAAMGHALHAVEDTLSRVRSGHAPVTAVLIGDCLTALDQVGEWLEVMAATGETPQNAQPAAEAIAARFAAPASPVLDAMPDNVAGGIDQAAIFRTVVQAQIDLLADGSDPGRLGSARRAAANSLRHLGRDEDAGRIEAAEGQAALHSAIQSLLQDRPDPTAPGATEARALRVDVARIDALVRLTGELTVVKNALGHLSRLSQSGGEAQAVASGLKDQQARLDRLVSELQRSVLAIRVLPLSHIFQRFPRLVREMAAELGKPVRLTTEGEDTEADKAIVESLFEPLLHVIRNAIDHGLEGLEARAASSKSPTATLRLRAARQGDHVLVEVEDDGAGVDLARVREVARQRGLASVEALAAMDDAEALELIFKPGFSTAAQVTKLSGRGVGMDVVRNAVERMGGRVRIETQAGAGTAVRFVLPFTVMMTRVMTVEAGGQMFGVPLEAIIETVRVSRERISPIGAAAAFVLRGRTLPLCDLAQLLGARDGAPATQDAAVVVVRTDGQIGGLEVDRVGEPMDVMLKPMDALLSGVGGLAGATLLGDGRVLLVLDLDELLQ